MRRWWLAIALLLSLGINAGILATLGVQRFAGHPGEVPLPPGPPPRLAELADRLGLEGGRREEFLAMQRRFFATMVEERRRLAELRRGLRRELTAREPDRERIDRLAGEMVSAYAALDRALIDNVLASREILDEEQERLFLRYVARLRAAAGGGPGAERPFRRRPSRPRQPPG